jgi:hypothetical protein
MLRVSKHRDSFPTLDDDPVFHHHEGVAELSDHGQIVRDDDQREPHCLLKGFEERQNLCLNGEVEGGDGFVTDENFWSSG